MWFAINVKPGSEAQALGLLQPSASRAGLQELFSPGAVVARRRGSDGAWAEAVEPLIPGCVVAVAPSAREVRACIRRAHGMEDLLVGGELTAPMAAEEVAFIQVLTQPGNRTVGLSEGVVDRGRVVVQSGPLRGREGMIRRVSHRKRRAYLDASVAGRPAVAEVGLRVTRKAEEEL